MRITTIVVLCLVCEVTLAAQEKPKAVGGAVFISNQSLAIPAVELVAKLNGKAFAQQKFDVKKLHNWVRFYVRYERGMNSLRVETKDGKTIGQASFNIEDKTKNVVIDYWKSKDDKTPHGYFTFYISPDEIYFR